MRKLKKALSLLISAVMLLSVLAVMPFTASAATVTATPNWGASDDGIFYVNSPADFLAMAANAANTSPQWYVGKTVKITADLDMTGVTWTQAASFRGTLDGQGHKITNLNLTSAGLFGNMGGADPNFCVVKDLAIIGATVNAAHPAVFARDALTGTGVKVIFKNVYVSSTINLAASSQYAGTFLGKTNSGAGEARFENCVAVTKFVGDAVAEIGGFIGQTQAAAFDINMTDCASYVDFSEATAVRGMGGFVGFWRSNSLSLTRCVSACTEANQTHYGAIASFGNASAATLNLNDCYTTVNGKSFIGKGSATTNNFAVNVKYDGASALAVATGTAVDTTISQTNGAVKAIANGATVNIQASDLVAKLGSSWVVTDETVSYGDGLTYTKVVPQSIDFLVNEGKVVDAVSTEYLQFAEGENGNYHVRFVGTVNTDSLDAYKAVGFTVEVRLADGTLVKKETVSTSTVYSAIKAAGVDVSAESLGADFLNVLEITNFKADNLYNIKITAFAQTADGATVYDYDGACELSVQNGAKA